MKKRYILCKECKKRIYFDEDIGIDNFWCESCYEKKLANPVFQCKLSDINYKEVIKILEKSDCEGLSDLWFSYDDGKEELRVIR